MKGIVDRFEGKYAVVELDSNIMKNIPIEKLPNGIREGDVISIGEKDIVIDKKETKKRKEDIEKLMNEVFEE
ncbi:DUF3006 domain-containing protein [Dethiothermospora halolimnae]|uniref:DUF3006 domain-containing protein n=1 Tax=Dethiothermospora halolimnae TaxID=3114390 RepID=UPI003CCC1993